MDKTHYLIIALLALIVIMLVMKPAEGFEVASNGVCGDMARSYCSKPPMNSLVNAVALRNIVSDCGDGYTLGKASPKCGMKPWMKLRGGAPGIVLPKDLIE